MSNKRREAERNLGVFLSPSDMGGGGFLVPMDGLNSGPGEPGPGDEWHVPVGPVEAEDVVIADPVHSDAVAVPPRTTRKG
jgi:hypothetical protein